MVSPAGQQRRQRARRQDGRGARGPCRHRCWCRSDADEEHVPLDQDSPVQFHPHSPAVSSRARPRRPLGRPTAPAMASGGPHTSPRLRRPHSAPHRRQRCRRRRPASPVTEDARTTPRRRRRRPAILRSGPARPASLPPGDRLGDRRARRPQSRRSRPGQPPPGPASPGMDGVEQGDHHAEEDRTVGVAQADVNVRCSRGHRHATKGQRSRRARARGPSTTSRRASPSKALRSGWSSAARTSRRPGRSRCRRR